MSVPREIPGWFLCFDEAEEKIVRETLSEQEYSIDPAGLREWIIDIMTEEPEDSEQKDRDTAARIAQYIKDNPAVVNIYAGLGKAAVQGIADLIKKARR